MAMKSLGKKHGNMAVEPAKENEMYYPGITLTQDILPALKGKEIEDKIMLTVEAKVCGISKYGNGEIEYRLDLMKAEVKQKGE